MEIDYKAIGQRIKIARIKKGITQEAVADLIDITPAHMSNVECLVYNKNTQNCRGDSPKLQREIPQ